MKIRSVDAIPITASFSETFKFGSTDRKASTNVIVRMETDEGLVGYGEACPVPAFTGETWHGIADKINGQLQAHLVGQDPTHNVPIMRTIEPLLVGSPFALTAIDTALHDLKGKALGVPVSTLLGGTFRDRVEQHGSVGLNTAEAMAKTATQQLGQGFRVLKLYAGRDTLDADLERLRAVRSAVGDEPPFILDINGRWSITTALRALPDLIDLGIVLLEQPVPAWDKPGQAELVAKSEIEIMADEAVFDAHDVAQVARDRTARTINLGLSKLGGLSRAADCATVARAAGLNSTVGSVLELGIATTAGLHLAASLPALASPTYLLGPLKYEQQISEPRIEVTDGHTTVPDGPGLGIEVDEEFLRAADMRK